MSRCVQECGETGSRRITEGCVSWDTSCNHSLPTPPDSDLAGYLDGVGWLGLRSSLPRMHCSPQMNPRRDMRLTSTLVL